MLRRASLRTGLFTSTLLMTAAALAGAQEIRAVTVGGGSGTMIAGGRGLPISEDALTAIVAQHFADALHSPESSRITIVVDANGQYVSGSAQKATIVTRTMNDAVASGANVHVDSVAGAVAVRVRLAGDAAAAAAGGGGAVSTFSRVEGSGARGVLGTDVSPESVSTIGTKTFAAGQMGDAAISVVVIKLK